MNLNQNINDTIDIPDETKRKSYNYSKTLSFWTMLLSGASLFYYSYILLYRSHDITNPTLFDNSNVNTNSTPTLFDNSNVNTNSTPTISNVNTTPTLSDNSNVNN
jgi:hypothetical protein